MRRTVFMLVMAVVCQVVAVTRALEPVGIKDVAWLQGCWEDRSPQRTIEEQWMAPRGTNMIGMGRTVRGDRLVDFELVVLREQDGALAYEAHPAGQPSAVFIARTVSESTVIFENPQHDFPQRIGYQRKGPDALLAWVEGTDKGQARRVEFPYRRTGCAGE